MKGNEIGGGGPSLTIPRGTSNGRGLDRDDFDEGADKN